MHVTFLVTATVVCLTQIKIRVVSVTCGSHRGRTDKEKSTTSRLSHFNPRKYKGQGITALARQSETVKWKCSAKSPRQCPISTIDVTRIPCTVCVGNSFSHPSHLRFSTSSKSLPPFCVLLCWARMPSPIGE